MPDAGQAPKHTVLIVDDEQSIREIYARKLTAEGFTVLTATDGPTGLEQAETHKPDLILLDVKMPHMGGFEMLKTLRKKSEWGAHVPAIFLTNIAPETDEANAAIEETGPAFYIMKSQMDPSELANKIRDVLGS